MPIIYKDNITPSAAQVTTLYNNAGLPRPTHDPERIQKMHGHSNLISTAWDGDTLVGVSRCITDWSWSCYLADLAVQPGYQKGRIGKKFIELTKEKQESSAWSCCSRFLMHLLIIKKWALQKKTGPLLFTEQNNSLQYLTVKKLTASAPSFYSYIVHDKANKIYCLHIAGLL